MKNATLKFAVLCAFAIGATGCHHHSSSRYDDNHHRRQRRHHPTGSYHYNHPEHVCSYDCHDHYWDGSVFVSIGRGHHHGDECGHQWNGKAWLSVKAYKSNGQGHGQYKKFKKSKKYKENKKYKKHKKKSKGYPGKGHGHGHGNGNDHHDH